MGAFAVAFILISGYVYVSTSTYQKYITRREDGHRYYFRCGTFGILFSVVGIIIAFVLDGYNVPSVVLNHVFNTSIEQLTGVTRYTKTFQDYLMLKLILGSGLAVCLARFTSFVENKIRSDEESRKFVHMVKSPALEKFLFECGSNLQTVLITLGSRKVYVGMVNDIPIESGEVEHFTILPILSGYRDKDKLTVTFTTNYYLHYKNNLDGNGDPLDGTGACLDDFIEMIPVSEIAHLGRFDIDTYKEFIKPIDDENIHTHSTPWMEPQSYVINNEGVVSMQPKSNL